MKTFVIPDWLYQTANIKVENLELYSSELYKLVNDIVDFDTSNTRFYAISDVQKIKRYCPKLIAELKDLGLADILAWVGFSIINERWENQEFKIHIDPISHDSIGLNLPVLNCKGSWTVWYSPKNVVESKLPFGEYYMFDGKIADGSGAIRYDDTGVIEIGRCSYETANWVNACIPHGVERTYKNTRIVASLRFTEDIMNFFDDPLLKNLIVK
jgi:hypothetical protein